jgi:F0F1-type ATP synthase membrane subunit b/b'
VLADARSQAQSEHDRILAEANAEVRLARQRAIDEAAATMGQAVFSAVERIVEHEVNAKTHQALIAEAVAAVSDQAKA